MARKGVTELINIKLFLPFTLNAFKYLPRRKGRAH